MTNYSGFNKSIDLTDRCGKNIREELNLYNGFTSLCLATCEAYAEDGRVVKISIWDIINALDTPYRKKKYGVEIS